MARFRYYVMTKAWIDSSESDHSVAYFRVEFEQVLTKLSAKHSESAPPLCVLPSFTVAHNSLCLNVVGALSECFADNVANTCSNPTGKYATEWSDSELSVHAFIIT